MNELPSNQLFFRIGDVARWLDVATHTVRFWEEEFGSHYLGHLERSKRGQRVYSRRNVTTFGIIKDLLYVELYTIEGAKRQLRLARERELGKVAS